MGKKKLHAYGNEDADDDDDDVDSTLPFTKMKLVPIELPVKKNHKKKKREFIDVAPKNMMSTDVLEKHIRHADPIVTAMSRSLPYISGMPPTQRKKLSSSMSVAVQNAHLARYKNLERLRESTQYSAPPIAHHPSLMDTQTLPPLPPPMATPVKNVAVGGDVDGVDGDGDAVLEVNINVPRTQKKKYSKLLSFLDKNSSSSIGKTRAGELVLGGRTLRGTSYNQAFRGLYVNTVDSPPGLRELVGHLKSLGMPAQLLSSKNAKLAYGQAGSGRKMRRAALVSRQTFVKLSPVLRVY
jgi:hypothetical protein